jgi:hypothetical protein
MRFEVKRGPDGLKTHLQGAEECLQTCLYIFICPKSRFDISKMRGKVVNGIEKWLITPFFLIVPEESLTASFYLSVYHWIVIFENIVKKLPCPISLSDFLHETGSTRVWNLLVTSARLGLWLQALSLLSPPCLYQKTLVVSWIRVWGWIAPLTLILKHSTLWSLP